MSSCAFTVLCLTAVVMSSLALLTCNNDDSLARKKYIHLFGVHAAVKGIAVIISWRDCVSIEDATLQFAHSLDNVSCGETEVSRQLDGGVLALNADIWSVNFIKTRCVAVSI